MRWRSTTRASPRQRLARQHAIDASEDRLPPAGELELQQLVAALRHDVRLGEAGVDQRARLRGEGKIVRPFDVVERLDAERVAREQQQLLRRVVNGERIHAAQGGSELDPPATVEIDGGRI
jgi:hypothetical protein